MNALTGPSRRHEADRKRSRVLDGLVQMGAAIALAALTALIVMDAQAVAAGAVQSDGAALRASALAALGGAWLLIAAGILHRARDAHHAHRAWRTVVRLAAAMLVGSLAAEVYGAVSSAALVPALAVDLGPIDCLPRRLLRLAAMAARAVPLLALLAAVEVAARSPARGAHGRGITRLAVRAEPYLLAGAVVLLAPLLAAAALIDRDLVFALPVAADATVVAALVATGRAFRDRDPLRLAGWSAICVAMVMGMVMGTYSFGGPLPTPSMVGDYGSLPRTVLRDAHVILMSLGILAVALRALGAARRGA